MAKRCFVQVVTEFWGAHYWADAPQEVGFLMSPHVHKFVVRASKEVSGLDREIEFFGLSKELNDMIDKMYGKVNGIYTLKGRSCEQVATELLEALGLSECAVFEDGINGSIVKEE